ncbi:MAG: acyl--CoA ligase [Proteobacteria bacterium]|nr:acyl--CoA ligase [Pseudomonadota bacterium]
MNLADLIRHHARRRPAHPAVVARDRTWSYADLDAATDTAALRLLERGVRKGDIVGIALGDTPEHLAFLWGIARAGAVILPMDKRWTEGEKQRVAQHFGARLTLIDAADPAIAGVECEAVEAPLRIDPAARAKLPDSPADPDLGFVLSLSSGTTGRPKGPLLTHRNFYHRFLIYYITLTFSEHDRFACASPLYFSGSRGFSLCALYAGSTVVLLPPPVSAATLIGEVNDYRCTSAFIVPTIVRRLIDANPSDGHCYPNLRVLISTGAALFPEDRELAMKKIAPNIINFYGSAEGSGISALTSAHPPEKSRSAGAIVWGTEVRVVDADFNDLPRGEIGRICYRSGGSAREFYRDPEASALAFRDGWYLPGDLGYVDADGFVYITGREKDMIIRGGVNVYPNEIESVLLGHGEVAEAAVVGAPSQQFGEEVVAYVTTRSPLDPEVLRALCARELAPYKVPKSVVVLPEMPRTNVGKIDKQRLRNSLP